MNRLQIYESNLKLPKNIKLLFFIRLFNISCTIQYKSLFFNIYYWFYNFEVGGK